MRSGARKDAWRVTVGKVFGVGLLGIVVTGMTVWGMGALYYSELSALLRNVLAMTFGLATVGAFLLLPRRRRTLLGFVLVWGALVLWWSTITPSNDRDWQPDVAVLPSATVDGDYVTLHNIRNFEYRTATDFTPRYYDKTFDLRRLQSVDLISSYWAGEAIAHLFGSFDFGGQDYVAISAEIRKERTEDYSTLKGFFKQYELFYVVADERDVIRLRTTYRQPQEDVYLYRTRVPPAQARRLFLDYVRDINRLAEQPAFYNTLTTNCTTAILFHARASGGIARYNWKVLLSGYAPAYAYEIGRLDTRLSFAELKRLSHINARANAAGDAPDFSQRIRVGLPIPPQIAGRHMETPSPH
jgi:hypothetical protein